MLGGVYSATPHPKAARFQLSKIISHPAYVPRCDIYVLSRVLWQNICSFRVMTFKLEIFKHYLFPIYFSYVSCDIKLFTE